LQLKITGMFENLNQPYPFNNNFKHNLRTISLVSMAFMLIVLYFQPFGINFMASSRNGYFVLIMGLICVVTFFLSTLIIPGLLPRLFESSRWTIRKELIWNGAMLIVLIAGFSLSAFIFSISSFQSLTLFRSGALAMLPLVLFNLMNYNRSLKVKAAQVIDSGRHWLAEERKSAQIAKNEHIVIVSENGKEMYTGGIGNIMLIQSASNYIEVFYRDGFQVRKQLIRQTLSVVEEVLEGLPNMRKCHRCTLVNIDQVSRLIGSSPNVTLEIDGLDFRIPVSRQRVALFRKLIKEK
jgi:hypothetical protein